MAKPVDLELKKAFGDLQVKMVDTRKKIHVIDTQILMLHRVLVHVDLTRKEVKALPSGTKTYESIGRMFLLTDLKDVHDSLKNKEVQLQLRTAELERSKQYLERNLKDSENNIREMIQQRKEQTFSIIKTN